MAALLTNRVPVIQGGAEVLELSAKDTKTLYYMPTGGVRRLTMSTVKDLESVRLRSVHLIVVVDGVLYSFPRIFSGASKRFFHGGCWLFRVMLVQRLSRQRWCVRCQDRPPPPRSVHERLSPFSRFLCVLSPAHGAPVPRLPG